ncbi:class I SAM-dependent methyltransferase [Aureibacter tunicatorum]|uniref:16S rRNA G1207 methylase RsmC n=1 Tax=Aureibacter tunicatorum TaxID=866807 RepID=A0AAE3XQ64_9BACT|nr:methyltransferase [Aureibacter tunicatorum]MDR6242001.1 16S rRNA G1207 methylase RsmC [Aureibacter tunicatorum]BDD07266.1 ribosomal RNA large subunit methyltransferase G [Aureibacter tunicatorum]
MKEYIGSNSKYKFDRYPKSNNRSLQPWNAGNELVLEYLEENNFDEVSPLIYNDRFGFFLVNLNGQEPLMVYNYRSQLKSWTNNLKLNQLENLYFDTMSPLDVELGLNADLAIIDIPKSLELFELYLIHASSHLSNDCTVICSFMTKHFSPKMLKVAEKYFENITQSRAKKKSRLLILKSKKELSSNISDCVNEIKLKEGNSLHQYYGVFSSGGVDIATQFFIDEMLLNEEQKVLDLASGNGVIGYEISKKLPNAEFHFLDDSLLAIASSKINLKDKNARFYFEDTLDKLDDNNYDLVVSNPPFHFEHENNIEVAISLFEETKRVLKNGGSFQLVANTHLNYKTHLTKIFDEVNILADNERFVVYKCIKS